MRLRTTTPLRLALAVPLLELYGRLVLATARVEAFNAPPPELTRGPVILALWHQSLFAVRWLHRPNPAPLAGLMSPSADGRLTRALAARFGIRGAVGSSSRQAVSGTRQLAELAKQGCSLFLTVDGPRGPAKVAKPGAVGLARLSGLPVIPATMRSATPCIRFRSWDDFVLPLPFARIEIGWGAPLPQGADTAAQTAALTAALLALEAPPLDKPATHR